MSKKAIALVVIIILLVIAGVGLAFYFSSNNEQESTSQNQSSNAQNQNNTENTSVTDTNNGDNAVNEENENTNQNTSTETQAEDTNRTLVVYFSMSGNTQTVANFIHESVGGDIVRLETEQTYPSDYDELVDYAQEEQRENARPALSTQIENIEQYDTIFLGYPNWWGDMPMPIYTFLDEYDLSGKTIAPFITHGGSGLSGTPQNIQEEEPNATVTEGLAISGSSASSSQSRVNEWLSKLGF